MGRRDMRLLGVEKPDIILAVFERFVLVAAAAPVEAASLEFEEDCEADTMDCSHASPVRTCALPAF